MPVEGLRGDAEQEDRSSEASANPVLYQNSAYLQVMCLQMAVLLVDSVWSFPG